MNNCCEAALLKLCEPITKGFPYAFPLVFRENGVLLDLTVNVPFLTIKPKFGTNLSKVSFTVIAAILENGLAVFGLSAIQTELMQSGEWEGFGGVQNFPSGALSHDFFVEACVREVLL